MKKRLLFAFMALCVTVSGFALSKNEFVYTPQGRFQITGDNLNANSAFLDLTGWTVVSASAEKTLADNFNINANGYAEGINSVVSLDATAGEGMRFKFELPDASASYVVSYKMKGDVAVGVRVKTVAVSTNLVQVYGEAAPEEEGGEPVINVVNTAEELTADWQTFNYAIVGDGTARTYYVSFSGMATNIEIADVQYAPAMQFADLRQRDAMLEKLNAYKDCYEWPAETLDEFAFNEAVTNLLAIGQESGQAELDEHLTTAQEILDEFLKENMDDYLATNADNYFTTWRAKWQKVNTIGEWTCLPNGRGFWENADQGCVDLGHFQSSAVWNNGAPTSPMGVYMQKDLDAGTYVFGIESKAALREPKKNDWNNDDGLKPAYGVAYVVKIVEGQETPDTIASIVKDLDPVTMTPFFVTAKIAEGGKYEIGYKAYCKESHQALAQGSVTYVYNASLWGKNENKYNQAQLGYEADVREQITTGRDALTKAAEYLANADYLWGKAELKACVDTVETNLAKFEAMDQDAIIATFDKDMYVKADRTKTEEAGLLVYKVYNEAVRDILSANNLFLAVNDTLNSIQVAIDAAEATMALRLYDKATGKDALTSAIEKAKSVQTQMKAAQYSQENAAAIVAANEELSSAVEEFKTTIPASAIATLVDIDFENDAVLNEETQLYSIIGATGTMEFSNFATDVTDAYPYQQGIWNNGEQQFKGYVRVGNGTGTVAFDPTIDGTTVGTNILKVNCDFFLQGLSGRFVGFYLENAADSVVAGFYANYYDNKIDDTSNLPIELGSLQYGSGSTYANRPPEGAEGADGTTLPKNSFEVILDFGEGSIYATTTSPKGIKTTAKQAFDKSVPVKFVLQSNYVNNDRRIWFDNLKIQRISAGATEQFDPSGIDAIKVAPVVEGIYTLSGQKLKTVPTKGIYIQNGKKIVVK
jgi:hypothetical protein